MRLLNWIKKQIDKIPNSPGLLKSGNWYVLYNDGNKSKNMTYDVCKDYAEMFGGKVYHITDKAPE